MRATGLHGAAAGRVVRRRVVVGWLVAVAFSLTSVATPATAEPVPPEAEPAAAMSTLAEAIPDVVGGLELEPVLLDGRAALRGAEPDDPVLALLDVAEAYGQPIEALSLATAGAVQGTRVIAVLGARWPGVPARELTDVIVPLVVGPTQDAPVVEDTVAGRDVLRVYVGVGAPGDDVYVLEGEEVVWFVVAGGDDLLELVAALP